MSIFALNQIKIFFIFILSGFFIGLLFDFFRILRKSFKTPDLITYIEDIIFWLITCILLAYTIYKYNNGELRAYVFIGVFIGTMLYILLISKHVINISVKIIKILKIFILNCFIYPIKIVLKVVKKFFLKPISFIILNFHNLFLHKFHNLFKIIIKKMHTRKDFS